MMTEYYRLLAPEMSQLLATGRVGRTEVPLRRSAYDNPDIFGEAWNWLENTATGVGKFFGNISKNYAGPGGSGSGLLPPPDSIGLDDWIDPVRRYASRGLQLPSGSTPFGMLADIGQDAMEGPVGTVVSGIGQAAVEWNPLKWVNNVLSSFGKPVPNGHDDDVVTDDLDTTSTEDDDGYDDANGDQDGGTTSNGGQGTTQLGDTSYVTEEGDVTNVYHQYYYDPNTSQDVEKASNDGLFGSGGGSLFTTMLMMMMMMPMMQGFGGLNQTVRAEPVRYQKDISGLFY